MRVGERAVTIAVADNGSGFDQLAIGSQKPNDVIAAQTRTGRRGFGLPIVKRIVRLHGQDLRIASRPGEGAVIEFTLEKLNIVRLSARPGETAVRRS
jgi:nitrogen fixation/metabolism regulation signal transduction histidine kinase